MASLKLAAKIKGTPGDPCCCIVPGGLQCRSKGGTASLCGFSEYVPSTPPKKYRSKTLSGVLNAVVYTKGTGCTGGVAGSFTVTWSGSCTYDASTCALTNNGHLVVAIAGGPTTDTPTCDGYADGCGVSVTQSSTSRSASSLGGCCSGASTDEVHSGSGTETLSDEDTEGAAIDRLMASVDWTGFTLIGTGPGTCEPNSCCKTVWSERTVGFSFAYAKAEAKATWGPGTLRPGWPHTVFVDLYTRPVGGSAWTHTEVLEYPMTPSGFGDGSLDFEVPTDRGFEHYVANPRAREDS